MKSGMIAAALGLIWMAACSPVAPVRTVEKGSEVAYYDFSEPGTFEEGTYEDGAARLQIREGAYTISLSEGDSVIYYAQWGDTLGDVVIEVEANQTSEDRNTVYGVMCRARGVVGQVSASMDPALETLASENPQGSIVIAQAEATPESTAEATAEVTAEATAEATREAAPEATTAATPQEGISESVSALNVNNGDGYLFVVDGSGRFAILRARGRTVTPLVDWTASSAIKAAPGQNRIRAACVGDYLSMTVNGTFVGDTSDDLYTQGQVGLVGAAAGRIGLQVRFDNLSVSEARLGS